MTEVEDAKITQKERQELFAFAKETYGASECNAVVKKILEDEGYESTTDLPVSVYNKIMSRMATDSRAKEEATVVDDFEELPED